MDIKSERIESLYAQIAALNLVYLPREPISVYELYDLNVQHRKEVEKVIQQKSITAEIATVELINKYVDSISISQYNRKGVWQFQLPKDQINVENWRREEVKPLDKFDWISFDRVIRPVATITEAERMEYCKSAFNHFLSVYEKII